MGIELIYAIMAIATAGILVAMLLLGGDADTDVDVDVDVDVDIDVDVDAGLDVDLGDIGGPGPLGLKLLLSFIMGFGLGGYLSTHYLWPIHHIAAGFVGGAVIYFLVYQLLKLLYRQQGNTQVSGHMIVGQPAVVTHRIGRGSTGEVRASDRKTGHTVYLRARSSQADVEFADGDNVVIKSVANGFATVDKAE
jgi:hypothetical protein